MLLLAAWALGFLGPLPVGAAALDAPAVEYLYIEANEHGASGGHVALRIGDDAYHYQQIEGLLQLEHTSWSGFQFQYGVIENRRVHATRLTLDEGRVARLEATLRRRLLLDRAQRDLRRDLRSESELISAWLETARGGNSVVSLDGVGFFEPRAPDSGSGVSAIAALRARIDRERGSGFLRSRARSLAASLETLAPAKDGPIARAAERDPAALAVYPMVRRFGDLVRAHRALEVLAGGYALRVTRTLKPGGFLATDDRVRLRELQSHLEADLARLAGTRRPDWGFPFLLGLARLAALEESLRAGTLVVLEVSDADAPSISPAQVAAVRDELVPLAIRSHREYRDALARWFAGGATRERRSAELEVAASRWLAMDRSLTSGLALRLPTAATLPRGRGKLAIEGRLLRPAWARNVGEAGLEAALAQARARERVFAASLDARHGYRLVTHNCVTALWQSLGPVWGDVGSERPDGGLMPFVPFVSARRIAALDLAAGTRTLPSRRIRLLAALAAAGGGDGSIGWRVALRESSPWTATLYRRNPRDSRFLFFTDDVFWRRPLLGSLNAVAGLAESVAGLLWFPVDRGELLTRGLRGTMSSVPELFFFNVRKGSYPFAVPPEFGEVGPSAD